MVSSYFILTIRWSEVIFISIIRWSRAIVVCWGFALLPTIPLIFNSTIERSWENKSNCKCLYPLDDVSICLMSPSFWDQQDPSSVRKYVFDFNTKIYNIWISTENLDVLDLRDKLSDSFLADLPHLDDDGTPFLCQSTHVRQQQVRNLIFFFFLNLH